MIAAPSPQGNPGHDLKRGAGRGSLIQRTVAVVFLGIALLHGLAATRSLTRPGEIDLFRDAAQARQIASGLWQSDPLYVGERSWYGLLAPGVIAGIAQITRGDIVETSLRFGPFLNLLPPVCFLVLVIELFGREVGVAALGAYLFLQPWQLPAFAVATYSPWLLTGVFAQTFFYLGMVTLARFDAGDGRGMFCALVLGLAGLAHPAPAMVLAPVIVICLTLGGRIGSAVWIVGLGTLLGAAAALSCAIHYGFSVRNAAPAQWVWPLLGRNALSDLADKLLSPGLGGALVGAFVLRGQAGPRSRRMILAWLGVAFGWLAIFWAAPMLREKGLVVPQPIPSFHFLLYVSATIPVFFGLGWVWAARRVVSGDGFGSQAIRALALALVIAAAGSGYELRPEFTSDRSKALVRSARSDEIQATAWIEAHTDMDAVFLTTDDLSMFVIALAGRKTVAGPEVFSNPFVDWETRSRHRDRLLDYARAGSEAEFRCLAQRRGATYVLVDRLTLPIDPPFLHTVFEIGQLRVLTFGEKTPYSGCP